MHACGAGCLEGVTGRLKSHSAMHSPEQELKEGIRCSESVLRRLNMSFRNSYANVLKCMCCFKGKIPPV